MVGGKTRLSLPGHLGVLDAEETVQRSDEKKCCDGGVELCREFLAKSFACVVLLNICTQCIL